MISYTELDEEWGQVNMTLDEIILVNEHLEH